MRVNVAKNKPVQTITNMIGSLARRQSRRSLFENLAVSLSLTRNGSSEPQARECSPSLRARHAISIIGDFASSNPAQSSNIRLAKRIAKVASVTRTSTSDFGGAPTEANFGLKNRVARNYVHDSTTALYKG
jgi:hypothetical protein